MNFKKIFPGNFACFYLLIAILIASFPISAFAANTNLQLAGCENLCITPDSLGDITNEVIGVSAASEPSLQTIFDSNGFGINAAADQKQYQVWNHDPLKTINFTVQNVVGYSAAVEIFGYYLDGDIDTFVPIFKSQDDPGFATIDFLSQGNKKDFAVNAGSKIGFAIKSYKDGVLKGVHTTQNSLNKDEFDAVLVYDLCSDYILAFEDTYPSSDNDYQDLIVKLGTPTCPLKAKSKIIPADVFSISINSIGLDASGQWSPRTIFESRTQWVVSSSFFF